jgi:sugar O-acyltransferase (sialic acid O-acetyltransferase NeuD family)
VLENKLNKPNLILLGGGGHCLSVIDVIERENKYFIKGILDSSIKDNNILGYPILGGDDKIPSLIDKNVFFLITVGQIKNFEIRKKISISLEKSNAKLGKVISPLAYVSPHAKINEGTVIMHQALVNAGAEIGKHCIINTKANIEHGVKIEDFCHVSTGAIVNGDSIVKRGTFVGSNATISNSITIEENSIISASKFVRR